MQQCCAAWWQLHLALIWVTVADNKRRCCFLLLPSFCRGTLSVVGQVLPKQPSPKRHEKLLMTLDQCHDATFSITVHIPIARSTIPVVYSHRERWESTDDSSTRARALVLESSGMHCIMPCRRWQAS